MTWAAWGAQLSKDASDTEKVARVKLAYALTYFTRGFPVVYYGDEQGFIGGGDPAGREDMMPSQVASYNAEDLLGTDKTTADDNFDSNHTIYQALKQYGQIHGDHVALRRGAQIHRYASTVAGVYAFSRLDRDEKVEYVLAFNNAAVPQRVAFPTYMPDTIFTAVYPEEGPDVMTGNDKQITLEVPGLNFVIYKADQTIPAAAARATDTSAEPEYTPIGVNFTSPAPNSIIWERPEIAVSLNTDRYAEVTFAVKQGDGAYQVIGTDNNSPYRVFYDVSSLPISTTLTFKAIVNDLSGNLASTTVTALVGKKPVEPPPPGYAVIHYYRPAGDYDGWGLHLWGDAIDPSEATDWATPKLPNGEDAYGKFFWIKLADPTKPVNFIIHKGDDKDTPNDRSFVPAGAREIWLKQDSATNFASSAAALGKTVIHYKRSDGNYDGWGLHLWGDAIDPTEATQWASPKLPTGADDYGAYFEIKLADPTKPVNFIVHKGDVKDPDADRSYYPGEELCGLAQDRRCGCLCSARRRRELRRDPLPPDSR